MADDTENHTVRLLQEMRKESAENFDALNDKIDGLTYIVTLLAARLHDVDARVETLEKRS